MRIAAIVGESSGGDARSRTGRVSCDRDAPIDAPAHDEETRMQAWLCENPVGAEALQWKELPTPQPEGGRGADRRSRAASLNFPDLLIVQNKYQFKPPLPFVPGARIRGHGRGGRRGRDALAGRATRSRPIGGTAASPTQACAERALRACRCRPASTSSDAAAFIMHLRHLAPRADGPRAAAGRRDGAGARRGRRRRHSRRSRSRKAMGARVIAAASSDEKLRAAAARTAPTRRSTTRRRRPARGAQGAHRRQGRRT